MSDESPETTDKGRPRPSGSTPSGTTKTSAPAAKKAPAKKAPASRTATGKPAAAKNGSTQGTAGSSSSASSVTTSTGPQGRPLTASDYAASTSASADSTAVIPAIKDEPKKAAPTQAAPSTPTPAPEQRQQLGGAGREATLRLSHVDPWSVTRMAFAISVALMIVAVVAVAIFWLVLEALGIWDQIDGSVTSVLSDDSSAFSITDYLGFGRLVGLTLVLSALNVLIATVLATIAAHLYNLGAQVLGGFQVTYTSQD